MLRIRAFWRELESSLLLRLGGAIAAITLLAVLGMAVSAMVALSTQGSGEAINQAGSLRMKSWQIASFILVAENASPGGRARILGNIEDFERTLESGAILAMVKEGGDSNLDRSYRIVWQEWRHVIRPRFVVMSGQAPPSGAERTTMIGDTTRFVDHIHDLVKHMEETTEAKILVMRVVLGMALVLTLLVVMLTIYLIHTRLVQPLRDLLRLSADVGQGNLATRTSYTGPDELGQLGSAFNLMAEDLSKLYGDLEGRVQQKTLELTRSNSALELLYNSIARLYGAPPGEAVYRGVLQEIEQKLDIGPGILCLGEAGGSQGNAIATTLQAGQCAPCDTASCRWCHSTDKTRFSTTPDFHQHLTLPLADAGQQYGVLILEIPQGRHLEAWQVQLLEALSRHIGVAIGAERQIDKNRRLGLLEERAVIARELHDSLAQSLAYMKIQVSRMKNALRTQSSPDKVENILEELREGLDSAYRQLRELLSSFRMKMEEGTLAQVLSRTVSEFSERGGLPIGLDIDMGACQLSPNEEIHVLHIVREALSNVMHHAQATHARVGLRCQPNGELTMTVEDGGVGIARAVEVHHYGMTIMEERARILRGRIDFDSQPGVGTRVTLTFTPSGTRNPAELKFA